MHKPHDSVGANGSDAVNAFIHQSPESRTNIDTRAHTDSVTPAQDRGGYAGYVVPTAPASASQQAADDRELVIDLLKDTRRRVRAMRALLHTVDPRLSDGLAAFQRQIDERLAWCLLAREDADAQS